MVVEFHGSVYKKNVVRQDEDIHNDVIEKLLTDFQDPEPVIGLVMGTSLQVYPFACVPNILPKKPVRVMVGYGIDSIGRCHPTGAYHETGISTHSFPVVFSYWKTTYTDPENPARNQHKKIKRSVRGKLEWGWGDHTSKKKWKDYKINGDVDEFSKAVMSVFGVFVDE